MCHIINMQLHLSLVFWTAVAVLNSDADCFHTVVTLPPPDCEGFDSFSEGVSKSNI